MSEVMDTQKDAEKDGKTAEENMEEDYIMQSIGGFGIWQAVVTVMVALTRLLAVWNIVSMLFLTPPTEFSCIKWKNNTKVPEVQRSTCYKQCEKYEYYPDVFEETITSQFDLICENEWMASFTQTVLMFGLLIGIYIFGWISDRFGRRKAMILSGYTSIVFMFIVPFSNSYWMFIILRFFIGLASSGIVAVSSVMSLENLGAKYSYEIGCLALAADGIAEGTLAIFAYYTSTWNQYLLSYTVVSVPILVMMLFIPETPRWMMANGDTDKTIVLMTKAAKMNNLQVEGIPEIINKSRENLKVLETPQDKTTYLDLFRTKQMALMTTSSFILWFIVGFTYFGLSQYVTMIGTDIYVVVAILGVIVAATCPLTVLISRFCGRKSSTILSLVIVGISMGAFIFIPEGTWTSTILGLVGISAGNIAFVVIYIYVSELYPTTMRNMGFSLSSSASKLGAMIAPFVANLRPQWTSALIFAILPFIAIVFCCFLPETKGKQIKDT